MSSTTEKETIGKHRPGLSTSVILPVHLNKEVGIQTRKPFHEKNTEISKFIFILHWNGLTDVLKYLWSHPL